MRDYGQVQTGFWVHPDVAPLSDGAKLLAVYLFSCPHSNALGCFRLPGGYVSSDLGWTPETVEERATELASAGLALRDAATGWTLIPNHLKWNPVQNPNVGKAVLRQARAVPSDFPHRERMVEALARLGSHLPEGWRRALGAPDACAAEAGTAPDFDAFLAAYPACPLGDGERGRTLAAYLRAAAAPLDARLVVRAAQAYAAWTRAGGTRPEPPSRWLGSGRWRDFVTDREPVSLAGEETPGGGNTR